MDEIAEFFHNKKNTVTLAVMALLILALPLGVYLVKQTQIFLPRAGGSAITVLLGDCVTTKNGQQALICGNVPLSLISPIGPPGTPPIPTPTPTGSGGGTPTPTPSGSGSPTPTPTPSVTTSGGFSPDTGSSLTNSLISYWKMDDTSGNLQDAKGQNVLTAAGRHQAYGQPGIKNKAVGLTNNFDTNETLFLCKNGSCAGSTKLDSPMGNGFSFQAWVNPASYAFAPTIAPQSIILNQVKGVTGYRISFDQNGKIRAEMGNSDCSNDSGFGYQSTTIPLNQWTHLLVTVSKDDPGTLKIYKNGQLIFTSPKTAYYCDNGGTFLIGSNAENSIPDFKYNGLIDEVGIWGRELTSQEVSDLYNSGQGNTYTPI